MVGVLRRKIYNISREAVIRKNCSVFLFHLIFVLLHFLPCSVEGFCLHKVYRFIHSLSSSVFYSTLGPKNIVWKSYFKLLYFNISHLSMEVLKLVSTRLESVAGKSRSRYWTALSLSSEAGIMIGARPSLVCMLGM